jgi:hypothetical protein
MLCLEKWGNRALRTWEKSDFGTYQPSLLNTTEPLIQE